MEITNELKMLGVVEGPIWKDCCSHDPSEYVATFTHACKVGPPENKRWMTETIDLYVIQCGSDSYQSVCLRFGNAPPDYYSGPIFTIWDIQHMPYALAKAILLVLGNIRWHRKEQS